MAHEEEIKRLKRAIEQQIRRADEERRRADEIRCLREQEMQNTKAIEAALRRQREEHNKTTRDQPLEDYLKHSKSTTYGQTDIIKKYYPLRICPWTGFPELCQRQFARIQDALGTQRLFPSAYELDLDEKRLLENLPAGFIESDAFFSDSKSSSFVYETLERPAQRIINAYLGTTGQETQLYFDGLSADWEMRHRRDSNAGSSSAEGQSGGGSGTETVIRQRRPKKILPDCLVLRMDMLSSEGGGGGGSSTAPYNPHEEEDKGGEEARTRVFSRVTVGEHKPFHRLRAAMLSRVQRDAIAEDFIVQLAQKASMKKPAPGVTTDVAGAVTQSTNIPGLIFFTYALAQTFHYMVTSGLEFGYMAAGESVSFLRVPRDEPTTLLYYTELFPQYYRAPTAADDAADETTAAVDVKTLAIARLCGLTLLALESPAVGPREVNIQLSQLAEFPNLPSSLREESAAALSPTTTSASSSRDSGRQRRHDEAGGDDDDVENGDDGGVRRRRTMAHRPRNPSPLEKPSTTPGQQPSDAATDDDATDEVSPAPRLAHSSQLARGRYGLPSLPSPFDPASFKPLRPYCTHLCLRGLMRGEDGVDHDCPNILLHLEAARRIRGPATADGVAGHRGHHRHPIGPAELTELVQQQLLNNVEQDCECLLRRGLNGAIGCLFRLTITGFGYTLVAKGVQSFHAHRLRHEDVIYRKLAAQQGVLIPVCLGVVTLRLPYPMTNGKLVTDMLLLSYAGTPLYSPSLQRWLEAGRVDVDAEACRTLGELRALGVEDEDDTSNGNLTWCESVGRVMKIDFDHVHVWEVQHPTTTAAATTTTTSIATTTATSIATPNKKKRPADGPPPGQLVREECRQKRRQQEQRHLTVTSLLLA
ncbi:hypothetical protein IF1G_00968 [Cordyceps javanica]|uniref:Metalloprotease m41 ftsh n=1 Tax=Cordyceps javanica TaxID=43265 RepID=A0A545WDZ5_9HYPO|nr:hypothetical protein IF1G_00968 [Cordyceps javanica]TQW12198.1 hypothetical protein IF2G_00929 [Cordyceps javanica]